MRQDPSDFRYALANTDVVLAPRSRLETFGTTLIDFTLLTEPMDTAGRTRIREGRIEAARPEILPVSGFAESALEGFASDAARAFVEWMREHASDLVVLRYGFRIRLSDVSVEELAEPLPDVLERVVARRRAEDGGMAAVVAGVEEPWEVCLLALLFRVVRESAPGNARALRRDPDGSRHDIEAAFRRAARDRSTLPELAELLRGKKMFDEYEERFFSLVRKA
jgi:hypothetical protein